MTSRLERFCRRHDITCKTTCGESVNVNIEDVKTWKERWSAILIDYTTKGLLNGDITDPCNRTLPTKTHPIKTISALKKKLENKILFGANIEREK